MNKVFSVVHWASVAWYVYEFGHAALMKVFQNEGMLQNMEKLGFDQIPTTIIGATELLGVILVLAGIFSHRLKLIGVMILIPCAIGAFTAHMAHREYHHYYNSLIMCVLSAVILFTDTRFRNAFATMMVPSGSQK